MDISVISVTSYNSLWKVTFVNMILLILIQSDQPGMDQHLSQHHQSTAGSILVETASTIKITSRWAQIAYNTTALDFTGDKKIIMKFTVFGFLPILVKQ